MGNRTGGELIQDFLETYSIPFVFGNPGTTETSFLAAVAASKATYVLALHESSAVGIAVGYALITGAPSVVSLHTYPGLANGMFNMRNALMSGVPLLVINGQQDSRFLIHNPVLGAPNTTLAGTATKYAYEVTRTDDLAVALQRCYLQARLQPAGPVFLSIPMNFMLEETGCTTFKRTRIIEDAVPCGIGELAGVLKGVPAGKLVIVTDYAVGAAHGIDAVSRIASALGADIYAAPFHVQGTVDPLHPNFRGQLPPTTRRINEALSRYHTMLLIGEKVDSFTYDGLSALPPELRVIQLAPAAGQLGFDFPCDIAVLGDIHATLNALAAALGGEAKAAAVRAIDEAALDAKYPASGAHASNALILSVLRHLDRMTHVITEGSSEDAIVQEMATALGFRNVHFSPRGGGLGWAMPLGVGIGLATGKPAVCFVGDGGSMYSIHALWTAAKYAIPCVFVCFVNHEYRLLKDLWCNEMRTTFETTHFVGLDFSDPNVDMQKIAEGFGARTERISSLDVVGGVLSRALAHAGPSFLIIDREP
ncbi:thiamine pyrophosphate-binding protein [Bordetella genomosp. 11]|uniref:Benzoylformate decarboxylase n=1 Tax=Bordetella genomosp. 11 TaxID=1416808 RepID=A0A261ULC7_9BORD|nr:thiamine pyrophosphate-binding protein [Bordetella genomosp. 11]OZI62455.1 benzoylformate decarboxylase [Bordetella genomosp. 11]